MDSDKTPLEEDNQSRLQRRLIINRLSLLCLIMITIAGVMVIFILVTGLLTNAFQASKPVSFIGEPSVTYQQEIHSDGFPDVMLKPMEHLVNSALHLIGLSSEHKSRRKRNLERENRIQLVDHNQLDRSEASLEDDDTPQDVGLGFDGLFHHFAGKNHTLKILYAPTGRDLNRHNDIIRSMRRRRKRNVETDAALRKKRYAMEYKALENEYTRCKKEAPDEKDCDKIYEKLKKLSEEINKNFVEMTNLIQDFKGKHPDLAEELSDSFPKKKDQHKKNKQKGNDSKESDENKERKTMKKDKPDHVVPSTTDWPETRPTPLEQQTDTYDPTSLTTNPELPSTAGLVTSTSPTLSSTPLEQQTVTYPPTSTLAELDLTTNSGILTTELPNTSGVVTYTPSHSTPDSLTHDKNDKFTEIDNNQIDDPAWTTRPTLASSSTTATISVSTIQPPMKSITEPTPKMQTLDDLFRSMSHTVRNESKVPAYKSENHKPVTDECVHSLDDLLETVDVFKSGNDTAKKCTKKHVKPSDTRSAQPAISESSAKNIPYDPKAHRPTVNDCIQSLDDLLEAVDLKSNATKQLQNCTKAPSGKRTHNQSGAVPDTTIDTLHSQFGQPSHPIHEELSDHSTEPQGIHDFIMARSRNRYQYNHDYVDNRFPTTIESPDSRTTKQMSHIAASGPFLNLCDQMRSQNQQGPIKTLSSNQHNFQAQQYGGFGQTNIPVSGETLKASSHVMFNSAYGGFVPNHFCFYQLPPQQSYGQRPFYAGGQTHPGEQHKFVPPHLINDPNIEKIIEPRVLSEGIINVPVNIHNLAGRRNAAGELETPNAQLICSLVQPGHSTESTLRAMEEQVDEERQNANETVSATESGTMPALDGEDSASFRARGNRRRHCVRGWIPCANGQQCIQSDSWCNSKTDCMDGSDESHCSCLVRLSQKRLCDGYIDCPLGEDEMGCFGCDKFSYSCFNNLHEYENSHKSGSMCYTTIEKCDGFDNCLNRKDEHDCTMLVKDLGSPLAFTVGYTTGILHRNHKGKWYPVCHNPAVLARDACESEVGPLDHEPLITQRQGQLPGPFIQQNHQSHHVFQPEFSETCNGVFNYVKCPPPKCGTSKLNEFPSARIKIRSKRNSPADEVVEAVRIVGGSDVEPAAYPFIVAIFRNGKFHCGGSIFNEHWIISAAHCCDDYHKHYIELRAGLLRRKSYAPQVQVTKVTHIIVHHGYSAVKMSNDISLMRSERSFQFNRWVRPICLPDRHRTTNTRDWRWGPSPGTLCTAIGWGALRERGGAPDHLKQVSVPILGRCKHKADREGLEICAAEDDGGQDACQGDSGGPFVCMSISNHHEWYLSGVVSHGEGCARPNEPGVYTRVALFIDWIHQKVQDHLPAVTTRLSCPGFHCSWGAHICLPSSKRCNGLVDCLGGEDEGNCPLDQLVGVIMNKTSNGTTTEIPKVTAPSVIANYAVVQNTTAPYVTTSTSTTVIPKVMVASVITPSSTTAIPKVLVDSNNATTNSKIYPTYTTTSSMTDAPKVTTYVPYIASSTTDATKDKKSSVHSTTASSTINPKFRVEESMTEVPHDATTGVIVALLESDSITEHTTLKQSDADENTTKSSIVLESRTIADLNISEASSSVTEDHMTDPVTEPSPVTEPLWIQVDKTITDLKPHTPTSRLVTEANDNREAGMNVATVAPPEVNQPQTEKPEVIEEPEPLQTEQPQAAEELPQTENTNVRSEDAKSGDLEQTATQIDLITEPKPEHPFFRELADLHQNKHKRLNQFRLSTHNLHTSLKNMSESTLNDTYRYKRFVCSKIHQTINIAHRCDRTIDCEDGTDEVSCTCRDYLQDKYNFLICDGKTDCWDLTDEKNCFQCPAGKYPCRMSRVCIEERQFCDNHPDCPLHEDELDCLALTDGHRIYFDANNLSMFKYQGLVTKNTKGVWNVICGAQLTNTTGHSAGKICSFLGFAGYHNYSHFKLEPDVNVSASHEYLLDRALLIKSYRNISSEAHCQALHITCLPYINASEHEISHFENQHKEQPVQVNIKPINPIERPHLHPYITFHENAHIEFIENFGDDYDWPWNTDIYFEGLFLCSAMIINVNWIIVDSSCMRLINLKHDYILVVAGGAKSYLNIAGPYEQVARVDCYHFLPDARVVMLHLEKKLTFTRHVLPTFIPEKSHKIEDNQCLAVGQDKLGRTRTLRVHLNMTDCTPEKYICYQRNPEQGYYHAEHCYSEAATRSGVVVCKTKLSGWYPVGFYQNKRGLCGFNEIVKMISLKEFYDDIQHVLGHQKCDYDFPEPPCDGLRCRYGKCINQTLVCDRKLDCSDGSDELPELCATRNSTVVACSPTQFRCGNSQCVDKSKFCDGRNDCGDLSDEPHECSCYSYLKVTEPSKICDGIRNCWDKSDENPRLCKCQETSFRCGNSSSCVPHDYVCDNEIDCPGGEDEQYCYALQKNPAETNFGEVMQQSFGIWHSKCFPKNGKYDDASIKEICESIGYHRIPKVYGRKMIHESRLRTANSTDDPVDRLRKAPTKAVVLNKFSKVVINDNQAFFMKPSRPMFKLVNWDDQDEHNCDRLEINCGD